MRRPFGFETHGMRIDAERFLRAVGEHDRRLEARHQPLVAVRARVCERVDRLRVLDDAADVIERDVRKSRVALAGEDVLAALLQRLVHVHAAAVVADERLRHEGERLAVAVRDVPQRVLEDLDLVALLRQRVRSDVDLALAAGAHLVVVHLDLEAEFLAGLAHGRAQVLETVDRRHREVAALHARAMAEVAVFVGRAGIPGALHRVDDVAAAVQLVGPAHAVEDEELVLGAEQAGVGDPGGLEVGLGALRERARVAVVALHRRRLDDIAAQQQRRLLEERIDHRRRRIRHQDHVGLVDALPTGDGRAVEHLAVDEEVLVDHAGRDGDVLLLAARVREAQVAVRNLFLFDQLYDISRRHVRLPGSFAIERDPRHGAKTVPCEDRAGYYNNQSFMTASAMDDIRRALLRCAHDTRRTTQVRRHSGPPSAQSPRDAAQQAHQ